jgi:hypothetical protein
VIRRFAFLLTFALGSLLAQTADTTYPSIALPPWSYGMAVVPNVLTPISVPQKPGLRTVNTYYIDYLIVSNVSSTKVQITLTDNSTNCNGSNCQILSGVSISPNQLYVIPLQGIPAAGGVKWSASSANAIHGWIKGRF